MALLRTPRGTLIAGIVLSALSVAHPATVLADAPVFGPVTCQWGTGAATRFEYAFKAAEPSRGFVLKVYNGGLEDTTYELVSSSTIALNGPQGRV